MQKVKSIHFVGIKGVGLTPLAIIAKEAKITVTGSDVAEEFITDEALRNVGIIPFNGFSKDHIHPGIDLVVMTGAHGGYDNVEVKQAKAFSLPVMTKGEAVGAFMDGEILGRHMSGIAVAGSHGKTTTTGMIVTILRAANLDPSYIVGTGKIGAVDLPGHFGKGKFFIAESDEYATEPKYNHKAQFLWQFPDIALFTNIDHDHPDIYPTIESVANVFDQFTSNISNNGLLVGCGDDEHVYAILQKKQHKVLSYGFSPKNDYVITRVHVSGNQTFFRATSFGTDLGEFRLNVTGEHNALNALGAAIVALEAGVSLDSVKAGLSAFTGAKRRLEYKGQLATGAYVFDDYAHHPTEISQTLRALRMRYPREKIIAVFQPHTYTRTKALFSEFTKAFAAANELILMDIYGSLRENPDPSVSSKLLAESIANTQGVVHYVPTQEEVAAFITGKKVRDDTVLVFMGAGDIYKTIDMLDIV